MKLPIFVREKNVSIDAMLGDGTITFTAYIEIGRIKRTVRLSMSPETILRLAHAIAIAGGTCRSDGTMDLAIGHAVHHFRNRNTERCGGCSPLVSNYDSTQFSHAVERAQANSVMSQTLDTLSQLCENATNNATRIKALTDQLHRLLEVVGTEPLVHQHEK